MRRISIIGLLLLFALPVANAGTKITFAYSGTDGERKVNEKRIAHIGNNQVRVFAPNGSKNIDLVFDREKRRFTILNHRNRSYMIWDEAGIGRMLAQAQGVMEQMGTLLDNLPQSQRRQLQQMLGQPLPSSSKKPTVRHRHAGKTRKVAYMPCQVFTIDSDSGRSSEIFLAKYPDLELDKGDLDTLVAMRDLALQLLQNAREVLPFIDVELPDVNAPDLQGLPLEGRELTGQTSGKFRVLKISHQQKTSKGSFIPSGYQQRNLPIL